MSSYNYEQIKSNQSSAHVIFEYGTQIILPRRNKWETFLGYRRYKDFDESDAKGQDFATISHNSKYIVGVVADGVSQSFFGHIAAEIVSNQLHDYLRSNVANPPDEKLVVQYLQKLFPKAEKLLNNINLEEYPNILRKALEETKKQGTQAVFSAFILNTFTQTAVIYSVGDVETFVYQKDNSNLTEKKFTAQNSKGRWSSAGRSQLHLTMKSVEKVVAIIMYSDGLNTGNDREWGRNFNLSTLQRFIEQADIQAAKDDVSLICAISHRFFDKSARKILDSIKLSATNSTKIEKGFTKIPKFSDTLKKSKLPKVGEQVEIVSSRLRRNRLYLQTFFLCICLALLAGILLLQPGFDTQKSINNSSPNEETSIGQSNITNDTAAGNETKTGETKVYNIPSNISNTNYSQAGKSAVKASIIKEKSDTRQTSTTNQVLLSSRNLQSPMPENSENTNSVQANGKVESVVLPKPSENPKPESSNSSTTENKNISNKSLKGNTQNW